MRTTAGRRWTATPAITPGLVAAVVAVVSLAGCGQAVRDQAEPVARPAASGVLPAAPAAAGAPVAADDPMKVATCDDRQPAVASFRPKHPADWYLANDPAITRIKASPQGLRVGTSGDVRLWGARDPFTGQLDGFDTRLLQRIAAAIGVPVTYKVINYGERIPSLVSSEVDIVAHTMTINCPRWAQINFSTEYYRAGQRVLVRFDPLARGGKGAALQNNLRGLRGRSVCVAEGSTNIDTLRSISDAQKLKIKVVAVPDLGDCLVKFQQGEVEGITGDDTVLAGFKDQDPYADVVGPPLSVEPYGLGFAKADSGFTEFVNALLDQWRTDGTLQEIYQDTMGKAVKQAPPIPQSAYGRTTVTGG